MVRTSAELTHSETLFGSYLPYQEEEEARVTLESFYLLGDAYGRLDDLQWAIIGSLTSGRGAATAPPPGELKMILQSLDDDTWPLRLAIIELRGELRGTDHGVITKDEFTELATLYPAASSKLGKAHRSLPEVFCRIENNSGQKATDDLVTPDTRQQEEKALLSKMIAGTELFSIPPFREIYIPLRNEAESLAWLSEEILKPKYYSVTVPKGEKEVQAAVNNVTKLLNYLCESELKSKCASFVEHGSHLVTFFKTDKRAEWAEANAIENTERFKHYADFSTLSRDISKRGIPIWVPDDNGNHEVNRITKDGEHTSYGVFGQLQRHESEADSEDPLNSTGASKH